MEYCYTANHHLAVCTSAYSTTDQLRSKYLHKTHSSSSKTTPGHSQSHLQLSAGEWNPYQLNTFVPPNSISGQDLLYQSVLPRPLVRVDACLLVKYSWVVSTPSRKWVTSRRHHSCVYVLRMSSSESDFLFSTMKPMAIFAISVVGFILVFRNKSKRRPLDFYTNPGTHRYTPTLSYLTSPGRGQLMVLSLTSELAVDKECLICFIASKVTSEIIKFLIYKR